MRRPLLILLTLLVVLDFHATAQTFYKCDYVVNFKSYYSQNHDGTYHYLKSEPADTTLYKRKRRVMFSTSSLEIEGFDTVRIFSLSVTPILAPEDLHYQWKATGRTEGGYLYHETLVVSTPVKNGSKLVREFHVIKPIEYGSDGRRY